MICAVVFYILCWLHFIYRVKTGGRDEYGAGVYCADERCVVADSISSLTVFFGTVAVIVYILL